MTANVLRTPDERFQNLPEFSFPPHYQQVQDDSLGSLRMHYLDEGPRDAPVVLMLHGEPTWCYLYRKLIPPLVAAGYRAVAPDHIGFGRSDKLAARSDYSYQRHVEWLGQLLTALDLGRITLVCQDWGGPIGLRILSEMPQRFDAVLATNTLLPNCEPPPRGVADWPGTIVRDWVHLTRNLTDLPIGETVSSVAVWPLSSEVRRAYDAPFPDPSYKAAALEFPALIPIHPHLPGVAENRRAWEFLERFEKPFLTAFSDADPSTKAWEKVFRERVPGAKKQAHVEIAHAGHFVQEEQGEVLAEALLGLLNRLYR